MKKIITATLALAITLVLLGCNQAQTEINIDISAISSEIIEKCTFPEMFELEKSDIPSEFGVSEELVSEFYASVPVEYPGIERIFLIKVNDKAQLETAYEQLNTRFEMIKAEYKDYLPDEYAKAKDVEIIKSNDFISLVICSDNTTAKEIIESHIK